MVPKFRYIVIILLYLSASVSGQAGLDFQMVDTTTYKYYKSGDWDSLIILGNKAIKKGIDYKFLRQRLGYAFFIKGDYVRSDRNFRKALEYDSFDPFTLAYLYYTNLFLFQPETSGYYASMLSAGQKEDYMIRSSKLLESIDLELNPKFALSDIRSDPRYYRFGISSRPWPRIGIYQSVSAYNQQGTIQYPTQDVRFSIRQFEYYGIIKYSLLPHLTIKGGYHFLYSDFSSTISYSNLIYAGLSSDFGILNVSADASVINNTMVTVRQTGLKVGVRLPGSLNLSFTGGISLLNQQDSSSLIYTGRAGFRISRKISMAADITYGYMNYYNDFDGLYVYNSIDPGIFKTGLTTYFLVKDQITLLVNVGTERKEYFENNNYNYNQISFSGGVIWRF